MKIANGVYVLEVESEVMGGMKKVYPVVVEADKNSKDLVLFDTCFPGQYDALVAEFTKEGLDIKNLTKIVLTHHDIDHVGNITEIMSSIENGENGKKVEIIAHDIEAKYVSGEKTPVKLERTKNLSEQLKHFVSSFKAEFEKNKVNVSRVLRDGEILEFVEDIEAVLTPGHTPGHTCYYFEESRILIAGDMLTIKDGKLVKADESINDDNVENMKSLEKLTNYPIDTVVTFHGGVCSTDVNDTLFQIIK